MIKWLHSEHSGFMSTPDNSHSYHLYIICKFDLSLSAGAETTYESSLMCIFRWFHALQRFSKCAASVCSLYIHTVYQSDLLLPAVYLTLSWYPFRDANTLPHMLVQLTQRCGRTPISRRLWCNIAQISVEDNWMNLHRQRKHVDWNTKCPRQSRDMTIPFMPAYCARLVSNQICSLLFIIRHRMITFQQ